FAGAAPVVEASVGVGLGAGTAVGFLVVMASGLARAASVTPVPAGASGSTATGSMRAAPAAPTPAGAHLSKGVSS
ncbi:hypothetical protein, partial [Streptomyces sp. NPDC047043]|uniref:hypothetical protein n=1 Tax=Streptomyces sp. NPDC047043 TaxID=3154497 RepID=UPI0033F8E39C